VVNGETFTEGDPIRSLQRRTGSDRNLNARGTTMTAINTHTTRRAIFGAIGLAGSAVTITMAPVSPLPAATTGVSPELARLIEAADRADTAVELFNEKVLYPTQDASTERQNAVPHVRYVGGDFDGLGAIEYRTDKPGMIAVAKKVSAFSRNEPGVREVRNFLAAHLRRERKISAIKGAHNVPALLEQSDQLGYKAVEAVDTVIGFPCRSIADLNAKMAKVMEWDALENEGTGAIIAADIARLAARKA
jgi:hypothetical protein